MPRKPDKPSTVNVRLPRELWERIAARAASSDPRVSSVALLESIVRRWLEIHPGEGNRRG